METEHIALTGGRLGGKEVVFTPSVESWDLGTIKDFLHIDEQNVHIRCHYRRDTLEYAVFIEEKF